MGALKKQCAEEIEQRAAYADCHSEEEFFEQLSEAGVDEITWSKSLNADYGWWMYFNLK